MGYYFLPYYTTLSWCLLQLCLVFFLTADTWFYVFPFFFKCKNTYIELLVILNFVVSYENFPISFGKNITCASRPKICTCDNAKFIFNIMPLLNELLHLYR